MNAPPTPFQRLLLPGLAFKAVVIGGGYATGRELATFFLPSGPWGGLYGMLLAAIVWSAICIVTFLFAFRTGSGDYRTFFRHLLGRLWPAFEIAYFLALMLILAVFAAAAGAIGLALFDWPPVVGSLCLVVSVVLVATWGNDAVEGLFKYVSFLLYATYAVFVVLALTHFGGLIAIGFAAADTTSSGWMTGGLTYAGYNIIGAIIILSVVRHITTARDAVIAGALAGPLAMIPAAAFFVCMVAYYPDIENQSLPSDFLLGKLHIPAFRWLFQLMIFAALLESSTGGVHAINERVSHAWRSRGRSLSNRARLLVTAIVLTLSVFVAGRFGLVALIASGYRWISYVFLTIYVLPLMTIGIWRLWRQDLTPFIEPSRVESVPGDAGKTHRPP